jgi:hypothetical protein
MPGPTLDYDPSVYTYCKAGMYPAFISWDGLH